MDGHLRWEFAGRGNITRMFPDVQCPERLADVAETTGGIREEQMKGLCSSSCQVYIELGAFSEAFVSDFLAFEMCLNGCLTCFNVFLTYFKIC